MNFSIITPVYNEAGNIRPVVDEISAAVGSELFELIYVDDCSNDVTCRQILELKQRHPWLRLIRHQQRRSTRQPRPSAKAHLLAACRALL